MKHHIAASTLTVLGLATATLGVAAVGAAPALAASCSTVTVSSTGPLTGLVLSVSSVSLRQGGCVTFHNATAEKASVSVDGSSAASLAAGASGGKWAASSVGPHAVVATVSGVLPLPDAGLGSITVTAKPTPPPVPKASPTTAASHSPGSGSGSSSSGGSGGKGSGGSGGSGGSSGQSGSGNGHRGPGKLTTGGLLGGTGFSLPSIPLGTFSHEGLATLGAGTAPQLAPQVGASTDAAGNPLPLVNGSGSQQMALAGDSHSSGSHSLLAFLLAGLVILGAAAALVISRRRGGAVDSGQAAGVHQG